MFMITIINTLNTCVLTSELLKVTIVAITTVTIITICIVYNIFEKEPRIQNNLIIPKIACVQKSKFEHINKYFQKIRPVNYETIEFSKLHCGIVQCLIPSLTVPLFCLVNSKSGGRQGAKIIKVLKRFLNKSCQIIDINKIPPSDVIPQICLIANSVIMVAGGDGTITWILNSISEVKNKKYIPPVVPLPLGTGNDLSYVLGWGQSVVCQDIPIILGKIYNNIHDPRENVIKIDRWKLNLCNTYNNNRKKYIFTNYFSIGVDAQIAYNFHVLRNSNPQNFASQTINKLWYGLVGGNQILDPVCTKLEENIELFINGIQIELPTDIQGLIFCNIKSYAGGVCIWNESECDTLLENNTSNIWKQQDHNDRYLEILTVDGSFHLANIKIGLSTCNQLAQPFFHNNDCKIVIKTKSILPMQFDGEPWLENGNTTVTIEFYEKAIMLNNKIDL